VPADSPSKLLSRHSALTPFDNSFNDKSVIGKLNYLKKGSRSDIAYSTHQCAQFTQGPKVEHAQALRWLGRYSTLKPPGTKVQHYDLAMTQTWKYMSTPILQVTSNWDSNETWYQDTAQSRHWYINSYAGCPIIWKSQ
jgi:hypothetical protein